MAKSASERRIVVGVDGSESSRSALAWAVRQAVLVGATVDAVHAWDVPATFDMVPLGANPDELEKAADRLLADTVVGVVGVHPPVTVRARVMQGHPASILIRAARGAELLVVGSRGHGGFVGALLGSVGQHCVQHADCPVVVIRGTPC